MNWQIVRAGEKISGSYLCIGLVMNGVTLVCLFNKHAPERDYLPKEALDDPVIA